MESAQHFYSLFHCNYSQSYNFSQKFGLREHVRRHVRTDFHFSLSQKSTFTAIPMLMMVCLVGAKWTLSNDESSVTTSWGLSTVATAVCIEEHGLGYRLIICRKPATKIQSKLWPKWWQIRKKCFHPIPDDIGHLEYFCIEAMFISSRGIRFNYSHWPVEQRPLSDTTTKKDRRNRLRDAKISFNRLSCAHKTC